MIDKGTSLPSLRRVVLLTVKFYKKIQGSVACNLLCSDGAEVSIRFVDSLPNSVSVSKYIGTQLGRGSSIGMLSLLYP